MHLLLHLVTLAGQAFFSGLWQGTALVLALALLFHLQPRITPSARFVISTVAFVLAAFLPLIHARHLTSSASSSGHSAVHVAPIFTLGIAAAWLFLSAGRLVALLLKALRVRRIWAAATPVAVEPETAVILRTLGRRASLCTSPDIDSPCVIGFIAPRLLIPSALMSQISPTDLHQIVLHECTHLHRYDDWVNLAQKVGLALFPLNPALFWIDRRLGLERELACDAAVVARTASPFDYARCLTRLAEHRLCSRRLALALSAWGRQTELLQRVQQLLCPTRTISSLQARSAVALTGIALLTGSFFMLRAPRLISFSTPQSAELATDTAPAPAKLSAPAAIPVTFRASAPAHATLLKYTPPPAPSQRRVPKPSTPKPSTPRSITTAPRPSAKFLQTSAHSLSPRMVFQNAQQDQDVRPVYLFSVELSPSYAAVPYGNGWLIVQL